MKLILFALVLPLFAEAKITLALNWKAEPQFGGFYAAQAEGYFKEQGLDVEIIEGGSGTPTIQMLEAKKVDYAVISADELIVAKDRGAKDIIALFASFQHNPQGIVTHKENPANSISELLHSNEGTLLWQEGLPYALFLKKKYGPIKIKMAPYSGGISLFLTDNKISQQCFLTSEPLLLEKEKVAFKAFAISEAGYDPYTTVLATSNSKLKSKRNEVRKILKAIEKGWFAYTTKPANAHALISKLNKTMTAETLRKSDSLQNKLLADVWTKSLPPQPVGHGKMTEARWATLNQQLVDIGVVKKTFKATEFFVNNP